MRNNIYEDIDNRRKKRREGREKKRWLMYVCMNDVRARLCHLPYRHHLHDGDIDALRLSKRTIAYMYVVVCTYMLLFLIASSSLSLTTQRYIQRGLYNQRRRPVGSIQCSYFLSYSPYNNNIAFFLCLKLPFFVQLLPRINSVRIKSR